MVQHAACRVVKSPAEVRPAAAPLGPVDAFSRRLVRRGGFSRHQTGRGRRCLPICIYMGLLRLPAGHSCERGLWRPSRLFLVWVRRCGGRAWARNAVARSGTAWGSRQVSRGCSTWPRWPGAAIGQWLGPGTRGGRCAGNRAGEPAGCRHQGTNRPDLRPKRTPSTSGNPGSQWWCPRRPRLAQRALGQGPHCVLPHQRDRAGAAR